MRKQHVQFVSDLFINIWTNQNLTHCILGYAIGDPKYCSICFYHLTMLAKKCYHCGGRKELLMRVNAEEKWMSDEKFNRWSLEWPPLSENILERINEMFMECLEYNSFVSQTQIRKIFEYIVGNRDIYSQENKGISIGLAILFAKFGFFSTSPSASFIFDFLEQRGEIACHLWALTINLVDSHRYQSLEEIQLVLETGPSSRAFDSVVQMCKNI